MCTGFKFERVEETRRYCCSPFGKPWITSLPRFTPQSEMHFRAQLHSLQSHFQTSISTCTSLYTFQVNRNPSLNHHDQHKTSKPAPSNTNVYPLLPRRLCPPHHNQPAQSHELAPLRVALGSRRTPPMVRSRAFSPCSSNYRHWQSILCWARLD